MGQTDTPRGDSGFEAGMVRARLGCVGQEPGLLALPVSKESNQSVISEVETNNKQTNPRPYPGESDILME